MKIMLLCTAACVAATTTVALPAFAAPASAGASELGGIGDIVVTAQKREERLNDVPMSITAMSKDELQNRGVTGPDDIAKIASGFVYTKSAYNTPVYTLRGVGFYDYSLGATPAVSVYVDQAPYPYAQLAQFAALDLERVEVLKGPQGTLFGVNSTGGAINYVAAKPTAEWTGHLGLTAASYGSYAVQGHVSGPISDTLKFRLAGQADQDGGWQKSITRGDSLGDKNLSAVRLLLDWKPSSDFHATLNLNYGRDRSESQAAQFLAVTPLQAAFYSASRPQVFNFPQATRARAADWGPGDNYFVHNRQYHAVLGLSYDLTPGLTLKSLSSYQKFHANSRFDSDGTPFAAFDGNSGGELEVKFQDIGLYGESGHASWIIAANYEADKVTQTQSGRGSTSRLFAAGITGVSTASDQDVENISVYGKFDYNLAPELTVTTGLRYSDTDRKFAGCTFADDASTAAFFSRTTGTTIPVGGCITRSANGAPLQTIRSRLKEDNVSWRIGLNWAPTAEMLLYANVSKGYKSGAYPIVSATSYLQMDPVKQESVLAYQLGFKATVDRTLQINGAAFYYDYRDKQVRGRIIDPVIGALSRLVNVPKSEIWGAELQARWRPMDGLTLAAEATYIDTKIVGDFNNIDFVGIAGNFKGQPLPFSPHWTANGDAEYVHALTDGWDWFVGGSMVYQSASNAGLGEVALADIKGYATLDLRAGVNSQDGRWRVSVWGRNVTNNYHWTSVALVTDVIVRYSAPPAIFGATVDLRF